MAPSKAKRQSQEAPGLGDAVIELTDEVKTLSGHVEVLRIAIDDLRQEVEWAIRNMPREPWRQTPPPPSMPRDVGSPIPNEHAHQGENIQSADKQKNGALGEEPAQGTLWA